MMLERLGAAAPDARAGMAANDPQALLQRMQQALTEADRRPDLTPEFDTKPLPPSIEDIMDALVRRWWSSDFLRAMLLGDPDEKLGMKPEPYA